MSKHSVEDFINAIAPFTSLWRSTRIVCIAVESSGRFINLGCQIRFDHSLCSGHPLRHWFHDLESGMACAVFEHPCDAFGLSAIHEIVERNRFEVPTPEGEVTIFFSPTAAENPQLTGAVNWHYSRISPDAMEDDPISPQFRFSLTGGGNYRTGDFAEHRRWELMDTYLKTQSTPYDGVRGVLDAFAPTFSIPREYSSSPLVEVVAPVPVRIDIRCAEDTRVVSPPDAIGMLTVAAFFDGDSPGSRCGIVTTSEKADQGGYVSSVVEIDWPIGSRAADVVVLAGRQEIIRRRIRRESSIPGILAGVDSFFDEEHNGLRKSLLNPHDKSKGDGFEVSVTRLLALFGFNSIWYGRIPTTSKPDLAALFARPDGATVLLGECTLEDPSKKYSSLASRAEELRQRLKGERAEVIPAVFLGNTSTTQDRQGAAQWGIALIGRCEFKTLFEQLESGCSGPGGVLHFIKQLLLPSFTGFTDPNAPW